MSDYHTIANHLDNNYSDDELLDYTQRNGLWKQGMGRQQMLHATADALANNGYTVGFTKNEQGSEDNGLSNYSYGRRGGLSARNYAYDRDEDDREDYSYTDRKAEEARYGGYRGREEAWAERRGLGNERRRNYASPVGNAEVAIGSRRRRSLSPGRSALTGVDNDTYVGSPSRSYEPLAADNLSPGGLREAQQHPYSRSYREGVLRSPVTPGEAEYLHLEESNQLIPYEEDIESTERSYRSEPGRRRHRRSRHKAGPIPQGPQDCPAGTYFREGYYRDATMMHFNGKLIPRRGSYVEATCAHMPEGNPWWNEIHQFAQEHPGVSGAEAAQDLSREMAKGEISHKSIYGSPRRRAPRSEVLSAARQAGVQA